MKKTVALADVRLADRVRTLLERSGRRWVPAPLPPDVERAAERHCFCNAALLALVRPDLSYVEGHADFGEHAWCVDSEGRVVDPTWPADIPSPSDYFGVAFRTKWVFDVLKRANPNRKFDTWRWGVIFSFMSGNPALTANPDEMIDPRWRETNEDDP